MNGINLPHFARGAVLGLTSETIYHTQPNLRVVRLITALFGLIIMRTDNTNKTETRSFVCGLIVGLMATRQIFQIARMIQIRNRH